MIEEWITKEDLISLFKYAELMGMCVAPIDLEKQYGCTNFNGNIPDLYRNIAWALENDTTIHISDGKDDYYKECMQAINNDLEIAEETYG